MQRGHKHQHLMITHHQVRTVRCVACVCACERAAAVIRAVESKRRSATTGAIEGAVLKDA